MSKYVDIGGYNGTAYTQSVLWHYRTDVDSDVWGRWLVNIVDQGVLVYTPSSSGGGETAVTVAAGTSFLIKEKASVSPNVKIAKVDMVGNYSISTATGYAAGTYSLIAIWENAADEYRGVEYYLYTAAEVLDLDTLGYNYVKFGEVAINASGQVTANNTTGQTQASMYSGLVGWSGESGFSGLGLSGFSGEIGTSGFSGISGWSGVKGEIGPGGGDSGFSGPQGTSGFSGISGYSSTITGPQGTSGFSGNSGFSGYTGSECIMIACSDEISPITTGLKATFKMPYAMTVSRVKATLTTAGSTTTVVDVKKNAASIVSGSKPTLTVGLDSNYVIPTVTALADDDKMTVHVDTAGTNATGLKLYIIGSKA